MDLGMGAADAGSHGGPVAAGRAEMEAGQQDRLETLTDSREARELTAEEALELEAIVVEGESLMVKKAEAYRLLTRRGFTIPWINQ